MPTVLESKSSPRYDAPVWWLGLHTAEGAYDDAPDNPSIDPGSADNLIDYFSDPDVRASSHAICDDDVLRDDLVPYSRAAWTLRGGNKYSDNLEQMGRAGWTREQWMRHPVMLRLAAVWIVRRVKARGWTLADIRHLTVAQVRARNVRGVIVHHDYTQAFNDGTHWDCGGGYPIDYVIALARTMYQTGTQTAEPPTPEEDSMAGWTDADSNHLEHMDRVLSANEQAQTETLKALKTATDTLVTGTNKLIEAVDGLETLAQTIVDRLPTPEPPADPEPAQTV